jgi:hypothetical protein
MEGGWNHDDNDDYLLLVFKSSVRSSFWTLNNCNQFGLHPQVQ